MIKCPLNGLPAGNIQLLKRTAKHSYFIDSQLVSCLRLQIIKNLHGRHPFTFLPFFRRTEITMEQLFQRARLLKFTVRLLQNLFILIIQPVTLTLINGFHRLRVKLFVIDGSIDFDRSYHLNADKTTAASTDSCMEPILPMHGYGLSRPNSRHHKDILLQDCTKEQILNSGNGLHHDPRH